VVVTRSPTKMSNLSSSTSSRASASRGSSPGSTLPPGNSHFPPRAPARPRWAHNILPSRTITAPTTSTCFATARPPRYGGQLIRESPDFVEGSVPNQPGASTRKCRRCTRTANRQASCGSLVSPRWQPCFGYQGRHRRPTSPQERRWNHAPRSCPCGPTAIAGSVTTKRAPLPRPSLCTRTVPPCASTSALVMAKPIPEPP